jgi:hypothetical protein
MPSASTSMRGALLNCRFAVNGIQKASRLLGAGCGLAIRVLRDEYVPGPAGQLRLPAVSSRRRGGKILTNWSKER